MSRRKVKTGDVVCLKHELNYTIRTYMTVGEFVDGDTAQCYWFVDHDLHCAEINVGSLAIYGGEA